MESRRRQPIRPGQWLQILLAGVIGLAAGLGVAALQSPVYQSDMKFFVSAAGDANPGTSNQAGTFAQARVKSYPNLVASAQVTATVNSRLNLQLTPADLQSKITAQVPLDTTVLDVAVRDSRPAQAKRIADAMESVLPDFLQGLEGGNNATTEPIVVTTVQSPELASSASSPNRLIDAALGLIIGFAIGLGWVLLRIARDQSIRWTEDAETASGAPLLIEIPRGRRAHPTVLEGKSADSAQAEGYRQLRTSVQARSGGERSNVVVVTSARAQEGRTTTAVNLAMAMALAGRRVILIDGDLRQQSLSGSFGYRGESGLADVLLGRAPLADELRPWRDGLPLQVLPAGLRTQNPSELLTLPALAEIFDTCRLFADVVIVDSPPLLSVTDGSLLAGFSDGVILMVRHGRTTGENVSRAAGRLTEVKADIYGVVLNHVPGFAPPRSGPRRTIQRQPADGPAVIGRSVRVER